MRVNGTQLRMLVAVAVLSLCGACSHSNAAATPAGPVPGTFAGLAADAVNAVMTRWYVQGDTWRDCIGTTCRSRSADWGVDSMVNVLYERWKTTQDPVVVAMLRDVEPSEPHYGQPCTSPCNAGSDVPLWDAVAVMRTYAVTGTQNDLKVARDDYDVVARSTVFALGACPDIDYQNARSDGANTVVKTLETDANRILAAMLLWDQTKDPTLLADAKTMYAAVRRRFLDSTLALYTVYVQDQSSSCVQIPRRFFASANGVMMEAGLELSNATGDPAYAADAAATKHAIALLADPRGIFTDLQAENDIVEPLVLAMLRFAVDLNDAEARDWILRNAAAAANVRTADGTSYGRFFDGPAPAPGTIATIWQANGGFALLIAAAYLSPTGVPEARNPWPNATVQTQEITTGMLPYTFSFTGSGIALVGTIGETSAEPGHAHVLIDGQQMTDLTGIWQDKDVALTPSGQQPQLPNSVLFAWRWPSSGPHTITLAPGETNAKEGPSFVHVQRELVIP